MSDLNWLNASEVVAKISRKELSPVEIMETTLNRAETVQGDLNAFADIIGEQAMNDAREAEAALMRGDKLGPMHGLPIHVKDLFETKGSKTEFGSAALRGNIPDKDDVLVTRLRDAGAVIFGKTTTPEFGHKGQTDGPLFGTTLNPWNRARTSGGSSGGCAVAVATGTGTLGLGTDGAGSIRGPAAYCGTVGLKPTAGLLPYAGAADAFFNYAAAGPLSRDIQDSALMMSCISGPDNIDPWSLAAPKPRPTRIGTSLQGVRIGYIERTVNEHVAQDVLDNTKAVLDLLAARGAHIEPVTDEIEWGEDTGRIVYLANFAVMGEKLDQDLLDPDFRGFMELGQGHSAETYRKCQLARTRLYRKIQSLFDRYDILLSPTATRTALDADFDPIENKVYVDGKFNGTTRQGATPYLYPFNLTGNPGLAVPSGFASDGLPTSIQLVGPWYSDMDLLGIGSLIEQDRPWADKRPEKYAD